MSVRDIKRIMGILSKKERGYEAPGNIVEVMAIDMILLAGGYLMMVHDDFKDILPIMGISVVAFRSRFP